jgi:hypothetical protein
MQQQKCTFCPEYKALCLGQIQHNTLSTTHYIFKHAGDCIILWVCLPSAGTGGFFWDKKKLTKAKRRQNPSGKTWLILLSNRHWEANRPFCIIIT